jgi:hypothetical protein
MIAENLLKIQGGIIMKKTVRITNPKSLLLIISMVTMVTLMTLLMSVAAHAHNVKASIKAVNILGYQYVDQTTLKVFFDKGMYNLNQGQFKIETEGGSPVTISNMGTVSGTGCSGWNNPLSPGGTTVTLTTSSNLSYNTRYKVTVSSTAQMGNSFHLSLGDYLLHSDVQFFFKTPNSDGTYSGTPQLTLIPTGQYVGVSDNVEAISDIPIDTTYTNFNLSDMKLQKSSDNLTYTDVTMDTTLDTNSTTDAEYYTGQINDAHNCLFLPLTIGLNTTPAYNLLSYNEYYRLVLPAIKGYNGGDVLYTVPTPQDYFTTGQEDTPAGLGNLIQTVTGYTTNSVSLSWSDVATDNSGSAPDHYHVYYSENPYFNFVKSTDTVSHNGTTNTCTVTGLTSATTYYFRIVPANSVDEEGGFSPYVSQTTN